MGEVRKVTKRGESLTVTIPSEYCKELGIEGGTNIKFVVKDEKLVLEVV